MKLKELKAVSKTKQPLTIGIVSDGYDYSIRIQHFHHITPLTNNKDLRMVFKNLGDAEEVLRNIGIHHATLNQIIPHDEIVSSGAFSIRQEESRMPISF